jgi:hypothetical protein
MTVREHNSGVCGIRPSNNRARHGKTTLKYKENKVCYRRQNAVSWSWSRMSLATVLWNEMKWNEMICCEEVCVCVCVCVYTYVSIHTSPVFTGIWNMRFPRSLSLIVVSRLMKPCSLTGVPTFRRNVLPSVHKLQAANSLEILATTYKTTRRHKPQSHYLNTFTLLFSPRRYQRSTHKQEFNIYETRNKLQKCHEHEYKALLWKASISK